MALFASIVIFFTGVNLGLMLNGAEAFSDILPSGLPIKVTLQEGGKMRQDLTPQKTLVLRWKGGFTVLKEEDIKDAAWKKQLVDAAQNGQPLLLE